MINLRIRTGLEDLTVPGSSQHWSARPWTIRGGEVVTTFPYVFVGIFNDHW